MEGLFVLSLSSALEIEGGAGSPVSYAVDALRRDMGKTLEEQGPAGGTIRIAPLDPGLAPETWVIEAGASEMTVRASDNLGRVYALLFISGNFLGVTPYWYWNDQVFTKRPCVSVPWGTWRSPVYAVRFRGWFINDEQPIEFWKEDPENAEHYTIAFETLLRQGGNMILISYKYRKLASDMGLWITHSHADPLGSDKFAKVFPGQVPSFTVNGSLFEKLWEDGVIEQKGYKVVWNLGFRGQGDKPFWMDDPTSYSEKDRGELIAAAIKKQIEIVKRHVPEPVFCTNLYGEMAELYRNGNLQIPLGVIKVWGDNGYGRMVSRRQDNINLRTDAIPHTGDSGPHGIYYHCSFHDLQASNHITMSPNSTEFLASELVKSLEAGAGDYWIINSGPVKPHLFTLDLVAKIWQAGRVDTATWRESYAREYYGEAEAKALADLFGRYSKCTAVYGPNEDDHAGEQIWRHPVREILSQWMRGDSENCLESLIWLTGKVPFATQVEMLEKICLQSLPEWEVFCGDCGALRPKLGEEARVLFDDSLFLHGRLQLLGAAGALAFCRSFKAWVAGNFAPAFAFAYKALSYFKEGYDIMMKAAHGKWDGYYRGDCLTDTRLTVFCLDALASYLRVTGEGPGLHTWEEEYLRPPLERKIMRLGLIRKTRALDNDELAKALPEVPF
jgi:hypothetical protein